MPGGPIIGEAQIGLSLNDRGLETELRAAEAELKAAMRRMDREKAEAEIKIDVDQLRKDLKEAEGLVKSWEQKVEDAETRHQARYRKQQLEKAKLARDAAKAEVDSARQSLVAHKAESAELNRQQALLRAKERYERRIEQATKRAAREEERRTRGLKDSNSTLDRWVQSVTRMTVRLGPFTAQLAQFARAFVILGPAITGVAGGVAALTSALGAGLIGALGVGAAGLSGFALAAGGLALVMKPVVTQFKTAKQASDAYNKAVLQYGRNSDQAKTAQAKLNSVIAGVSPMARAAFRDLGMLSTAWQNQTKDARTALLEGMAGGIKTVKALLPDFAARTTQTAQIASREAQAIFGGLRSRSGRSTLDQIFGGFNQALPSLIRGAAAIAAAFGKVAAAFSRSSALGRVSSAFQGWADKINILASNRRKLNDFADTMTNAFIGIAKFGGAAGKVLTAFFKAGVGTGDSILSGWTGGLQKLADSMNSFSGQRSLANFFSQSAQTAHKLWTTVKPLGQLFFEMATIMRPFTNVALDVTTALSNLAHAAAQLAPVRGAIQGLFLAFTGASIARRVAEFGKMVGLLKTVETAGGALGRGGLATGATGLVGVLGRINPLVAALSLAAVGLGAAFSAGGGPAATLAGDLNKLADAADNANNSYKNLRDSLPGVADAEDRAKIAVHDARKELEKAKPGTDAHKLAVLNLRQALRDQAAAHKDTTSTIKQASKETGKAVKADAQAYATAEAGLRKIQDTTKKVMDQRAHAGVKGPAPFLREDAVAAEAASTAFANLQRALNIQAAAGLNAQRALRGLNPLVGEAEQKLGALARIQPKVAATVSLQFKGPKDAGAAAEAATKALARGATARQVIKIVADSSSAQAAIRKLNGLHLDNKQVNVKADVLNALAGISHVNKVQVPGKILAIAANIGSAIAGYGKVRGLKNIIRLLAMTGIDNGARSLWNSLNGLSNIVKTFTVVKRILGGGKAEGGYVSAEDKRMGAAQAAAARAPMRSSTAGGVVTRPTYLTGEENRREWVIADNPAYRSSNVHYLAEAAKEFGLTLASPEGFIIAAAKGHHPGKKKALPVPKAVRFGAVPEDKLQGENDRAEKRYTDRRDKVKELEGKLKTEKSAKARAALQRQLEAAQKGAHGKPSLETLHRRFEVAHHDLQVLKAYNRKLDRWDTEQETDRQKMENAAKIGDVGAYNKAKTDRGKLLGQLERAYKKAARLAHNPDLIATLNSKLATVQGEQIDLSQAEDPFAIGSVDDYLKSIGKDSTLAGLQKALALAGVDTPNDPTDDRRAAGNLVTFWEGILSQARNSGVPDGIITEIAGDLSDARSTVTGLLAPSADEQAITDQIKEQARLYRATQSTNAAYNAVAAGAGGLGLTAGQIPVDMSAVSPALNLNIYTLHPGSPDTLRAIGDAAAAGFGFQGSVRATRLRTGY